MIYIINLDFQRVHSFAEADAMLTEYKGHLSKLKSGIKSLRELDANDKADTYRLLDRPMPEGVASMRHLAFRLYNTDVVTYREDGAVIVKRYPSQATNAFANRLEPRYLAFHFATDNHNTWRPVSGTTNPWRFNTIMCDNVGGPTDGAKWWTTDQKRVYRIRRDSAVLVQDKQGNFYPEDERDIAPWMVPTLDKPRATRALKATEYHAFMDWARATAMLTYTRQSYGKGDKVYRDDDSLLICLADQKRWPALLSDATYWPTEPPSGSGFAAVGLRRFTEAVKADRRGFYIRNHVRALGLALRGAVYRTRPGTLRVVPTPALANMQAVASCLKACQYYGVEA